MLSRLPLRKICLSAGEKPVELPKALKRIEVSNRGVASPRAAARNRCAAARGKLLREGRVFVVAAVVRS
jgi:hypothetical protein